MAPLPKWAAEGNGGGPTQATVVPEAVAPPANQSVVLTPPPPARAPRGTGRPIDLDVRNAEIGEVCRFIADAAGVNIVLGDGVSGTVTVSLKHVPWDTALEAILKAKGYRAERDGNIVEVLAR